MKPSLGFPANKPRLLLFTLLAASLLPGCGGGGGSAHRASRGRLAFGVKWPESQTRVIPTAAQSLLVQIKSGATVVDSGVIVRPSATLSFSALPVGTFTVVASAFASTDGTGTPLATASVPATIVDNQTTSVSVTLASTIDHLSVTPSPFVVGVGRTSTINVVAYDASGNVVLTDPSAWSFSSSNPGLATVTSAGVVTAGSGLGSGTITITEGDSGKTLSLPISVVPAVTVTPGTSSLTLRGTATFVASIVGTSNQAVTWSVEEGTPGGTVTSGGVYTAPSVRGTYHVVATSVADSTAKAVATVTVTAGGASVVVH